MWVKWLWHLLRRKEKDVYTFVFARIRVTIIDIWELKIHVKLGKFFCSKPRLFLQSKGLVFKKKDSFHHRYRSLCDWNSSCHRSPPYKYTYSHLRRQHKLHRFRKDQGYNHWYLTNTNKMLNDVNIFSHITFISTRCELEGKWRIIPWEQFLPS